MKQIKKLNIELLLDERTTNEHILDMVKESFECMDLVKFKFYKKKKIEAFITSIDLMIDKYGGLNIELKER